MLHAELFRRSVLNQVFQLLRIVITAMHRVIWSTHHVSYDDLGRLEERTASQWQSYHGGWADHSRFYGDRGGNIDDGL